MQELALSHTRAQAALVSVELIRTSILWHEMWHSALEEASRKIKNITSWDVLWFSRVLPTERTQGQTS